MIDCKNELNALPARKYQTAGELSAAREKIQWLQDQIERARFGAQIGRAAPRVFGPIGTLVGGLASVEEGIRIERLEGEIRQARDKELQLQGQLSALEELQTRCEYTVEITPGEMLAKGCAFR